MSEAPELPSGVRQLYPFQSHYLDLDGLRYHYLDEGEGPVVLFLHGNPTWSFYYRELILGLRERYRCIAPDHIGCGLSDKPQDYPYRLATHINNVAALLDHLEITRYSLACHDWGGPIGFGNAVEHPDRIDRLIVFNTTCLVTRRYPLSILACKLPVLGAIGVRGMNLFARLAVRLAARRPGRMTPEVKAGYLLPYDNWANRIAILRFVEDIPLGRQHPSWGTAKGVEERLSLLHGKPMLVIWGALDPCFDDFFLQAWRRDFPGADFHVLSDAGHYVVEDAAPELLPLLREFLGDTSPRVETKPG